METLKSALNGSSYSWHNLAGCSWQLTRFALIAYGTETTSYAMFSYSYLIGYLVASWPNNLVVCQAQFLGLCLEALLRKDSLILVISSQLRIGQTVVWSLMGDYRDKAFTVGHRVWPVIRSRTHTFIHHNSEQQSLSLQRSLVKWCQCPSTLRLGQGEMSHEGQEVIRRGRFLNL